MKKIRSPGQKLSKTMTFSSSYLKLGNFGGEMFPTVIEVEFGKNNSRVQKESFSILPNWKLLYPNPRMSSMRLVISNPLRMYKVRRR